MKKITSAVLALAMLASLCGTAFADGDVGFTPQDILTWLQQYDEAATTSDEQAANGAYRLAEILVYCTGVNATGSQVDTLNDILDQLAEGRNNGSSSEQKLAIGTIQAVRGLEVLAHQTDPDGKYDSYVENIMASFAQGDDNVDTAKGQAVNALYHAIKLVGLISEENCTSQDMIDQIEAGLGQVGEGDQAATNVDEQLINGGMWLFKLLGAYTKLKDDSKDEQIENLRASIQRDVDNSTNPMQVLTNWLYGSVYAVGVLTGDYTF